MSEQKVIALCLLDLSAAFNTIMIILFFFIAYLLGLVLMAQLFLGIHLIYHLEALSFLSTPLQLTPLCSLISYSSVGHSIC